MTLWKSEMSEERRYFVYIMANASRRLYTGMTTAFGDGFGSIS
jgi:predicted GIY-YIG superfamily endonuclease